jgi:hypothetical protein
VKAIAPGHRHPPHAPSIHAAKPLGMLALRLLLSLIFVVVASYTGVVISRHGIDLLAVFFGDLAKMGWAGQFNLDFMMLLFSALWVAWRTASARPGSLSHRWRSSVVRRSCASTC